MKVSNAKTPTTAENLSAEVGETNKVKNNSEEAFFSDQLGENNALTARGSMHRLKMLSYSSDQLKNRLRQIIGQNLINGLLLPEVVEGLTEFLAEIIREDPQQAKLLGVYD